MVIYIHWLTGLLLHDGGMRKIEFPVCYMHDPGLYEITSTQLTVDRKIEYSEIPDFLFDLESYAHSPDLFAHKRRFLSGQLAQLFQTQGLSDLQYIYGKPFSVFERRF